MAKSGIAAGSAVESDEHSPRRRARSLGQIVAILDTLAKAGVAFVALKENIRVEGKRDIQTKVMTTLFALFAEVERDLISERTREGLAKARASGRKLGRPKGSLGVSRLVSEHECCRYPHLHERARGGGGLRDRAEAPGCSTPRGPIPIGDVPSAEFDALYYQQAAVASPGPAPRSIKALLPSRLRQ